MTDLPLLESMAEVLLQRECNRACQRCPDCSAGPDLTACRWLVPELVRLLVEFPDTPVEALRPMVRRIVVEQVFAGENGDSLVGPARDSELDDEVHLALRVMERLRRYGGKRGVLGGPSAYVPFYD